MTSRLVRLLRLPLGLLARKLGLRFTTMVRSSLARQRDRHRPTISDQVAFPSPTPLLSPIPTVAFLPWASTILPVSTLLLDHRFDLLGSGWVQVRHGMSCRGIEGHRFPPGEAVEPTLDGAWLRGRVTEPNFSRSAKIWSLVDPGYVPIDWHLDFKSGYRWKETTWHRDIRYGDLPGVDVKVPWELSRLQHLPMLAYAFAIAREGHSEALPADRYLREFENQVLDFLATNPPRFGVNWACTMDVAIRAANLVVSFELFRTLDASFRPGFLSILQAAIEDHGWHCLHHLEYDPEIRNNHYLSDIAGLLWVAAWLPDSPRAGRWLAFAIQELVQETFDQFNEDGSNFEASTAYHRLSAEMVLYGALLVRSLGPDKRTSSVEANPWRLNGHPGLRSEGARGYDLGRPDPFPAQFSARLIKAVAFTTAITRPDGQIVQIGDNDNGRFLKLWPSYSPMLVAEAKERFHNLRDYDDLPDDAIHWEESFLDHHGFIDAGGLILNLPGEGSVETPELVVLRSILALRPTQVRQEVPLSSPPAHRGGSLEEAKRALTFRLGSPHAWEIHRPGIGQGLSLQVFPDFGIYLFRSPRLFLCLRAGATGQGGLGGHAHNDQLGMELCLDGEVLFQDPGTYLYSPVPEARNAFRSGRAHCRPWHESDPAPPSTLFNYASLPCAACTHLSIKGFVGELPYSARLVEVRPDGLLILDFGASQASPFPWYSPKYGALCARGPGSPLLFGTWGC